MQFLPREMQDMLGQLHLDHNGESDVRIPAIVKVIPIVIIDVEIIGFVPIVCPVFRPGINKEERHSRIFETRIPHVDRRENGQPEPVLPSEIQTEAVLRNVVTAIASALCPGAMIGFPAMSAILLESAVPLPSALLFPSPLLLPRGCLLARALGLLLTGLLGLLLRWPLLASLLGRLWLRRLLLAGLLGLLLLLLASLLGRLWLRLLLLPGLLGLLLRLPLRALLLCGWRRTTAALFAVLRLRLARFVLLLVLLRVCGDNCPEKQQKRCCSGCSYDLHGNHLRQRSPIGSARRRPV